MSDSTHPGQESQQQREEDGRLWEACQGLVQDHLQTGFWAAMYRDEDADCQIPLRTRNNLVVHAFVCVFFQVTKHLLETIANGNENPDGVDLPKIIQDLLQADPEDLRIPKGSPSKKHISIWAKTLGLHVSASGFVEKWEDKLFHLWTFLEDEFPLDWFEKIWQAKTIEDARTTLQESHPLVTNLIPLSGGPNPCRETEVVTAELWKSVFCRFEAVLGIEDTEWALLPARWVRVAFVAMDGNKDSHALEAWINPGMADANTGVFGIIDDAKGTWAVLRGDKAGDGGTIVQTTDYGESRWEPRVNISPDTKFPYWVGNPDNIHLSSTTQLSELAIAWGELACICLSSSGKQEFSLPDKTSASIATTRRPLKMPLEEALNEAQQLRELDYLAIWKLEPPAR